MNATPGIACTGAGMHLCCEDCYLNIHICFGTHPEAIFAKDGHGGILKMQNRSCQSNNLCISNPP